MRIVQAGQGRNKGRTKGVTVADTGSGAAPLALEVRQEAESGICHHFHWR